MLRWGYMHSRYTNTVNSGDVNPTIFLCKKDVVFRLNIMYNVYEDR